VKSLSIFEAIMLICFGAAWPVSIYKSIRSRTTKGKSLIFLIIILIGYVAGIAFKVTGKVDLVLGLYILNSIMVSIDLILFIRNRKLELKKAE
jgi:lipopolysaccharide export LptBFGC system permease protein LptF